MKRNAAFSSARLGAICLSAALLGAGLSACAPLVVGGAVGGALVAADRRTSGAQLEDQNIELKAATRLGDQFGDRARVIVTSFNRRVLLTGDVPTAADKAAAERTVAAVENVKVIVNELGVQSSPSLTARSADALVTARVKAAMIDAKDLQANTVKVVTERGSTYLMGVVSQREADRATEIARSISGVQRVVRVFEIVSEAELQRLQTAPAKK